jgi:hypothetical protein
MSRERFILSPSAAIRVSGACHEPRHRADHLLAKEAHRSEVAKFI